MKRRHLLPLMLLSANEGEPVKGRTRLQKLIFLIQQRLEEEGSTVEWGYHFRPYDYGPFAKGIYDDIEQLHRRGYVTEKEDRLDQDDDVIQYDYALTDEGREALRQYATQEELSNLQEMTEQVKGRFNSIHLQELIDYVYTEYPEYAENSELY